MARPRKDPNVKAEYHTKAKAWLVCSACDLSIPYTGKPDPTEGDGWPLHRCSKVNGKPVTFSYYTTDNPNPVIVRDWDSFDQPEPPIVMIG